MQSNEVQDIFKGGVPLDDFISGGGKSVAVSSTLAAIQASISTMNTDVATDISTTQASMERTTVVSSQRVTDNLTSMSSCLAAAHTGSTLCTGLSMTRRLLEEGPSEDPSWTSQGFFWAPPRRAQRLERDKRPRRANWEHDKTQEEKEKQDKLNIEQSRLEFEGESLRSPLHFPKWDVVFIEAEKTEIHARVAYVREQRRRKEAINLERSLIRDKCGHPENKNSPRCRRLTILDFYDETCAATCVQTGYPADNPMPTTTPSAVANMRQDSFDTIAAACKDSSTYTDFFGNTCGWYAQYDPGCQKAGSIEVQNNCPVTCDNCGASYITEIYALFDEQQWCYCSTADEWTMNGNRQLIFDIPNSADEFGFFREAGDAFSFEAWVKNPAGHALLQLYKGDDLCVEFGPREVGPYWSSSLSYQPYALRSDSTYSYPRHYPLQVVMEDVSMKMNAMTNGDQTLMLALDFCESQISASEFSDVRIASASYVSEMQSTTPPFIEDNYVLTGSKLEIIWSLTEEGVEFDEVNLQSYQQMSTERPWPSDDDVFYYLYLVTFALLVFFILLNFFLAIIVDAYAEVKKEVEKSALEEEDGEDGFLEENPWVTREQIVSMVPLFANTKRVCCGCCCSWCCCNRGKSTQGSMLTEAYDGEDDKWKNELRTQIQNPHQKVAASPTSPSKYAANVSVKSDGSFLDLEEPRGGDLRSLKSTRTLRRGESKKLTEKGMMKKILQKLEEQEELILELSTKLEAKLKEEPAVDARPTPLPPPIVFSTAPVPPPPPSHEIPASLRKAPETSRAPTETSRAPAETFRAPPETSRAPPETSRGVAAIPQTQQRFTGADSDDGSEFPTGRNFSGRPLRRPPKLVVAGRKPGIGMDSGPESPSP
uniref:Ion transport domain-containing protein n=1 Tax=Chromera velia CCMP2878 TaxID=1169474 RepID=A0A0G4HJ66_9ALVE|eukprot:Cvel_7050.t1-p1 / transcript=Cvel_7050.t1 / gene=Cvel_7050 / organism=Chromera_velia_CCMP2878 / gene_product=hypothetical protein / transcript_product=hypothetical protein / location=Cvel_scaffold360:18583-37133(-) / protein_length=879 / sequence_SO=supercontig / SO=protein_coding / is_pseudo=false